ncbi:MAG TPA: hypothetical protein VKQ27_12140 [Acetobacteraceae bacterium]|nr:hypothetical protein [Acetobacteraceae bacterium]
MDLMDNALRCPQSHNLIICLGEGFALLKDVEDRAERQRRNWIEAYRGLGDAGAVCRRFGVSPIDRVCQLADKTPLWAAVGDAYDASKERIKIRHHAVVVALQALKSSLGTAQVIVRPDPGGGSCKTVANIEGLGTLDIQALPGVNNPVASIFS